MLVFLKRIFFKAVFPGFKCYVVYIVTVPELCLEIIFSAQFLQSPIFRASRSKCVYKLLIEFAEKGFICVVYQFI